MSGPGMGGAGRFVLGFVLEGALGVLFRCLLPTLTESSQSHSRRPISAEKAKHPQLGIWEFKEQW